MKYFLLLAQQEINLKNDILNKGNVFLMLKHNLAKDTK